LAKTLAETREALREDMIERAAILEYNAGMTREDAEKLARAMVILKMTEAKK
jgi:hypothetical protein